MKQILIFLFVISFCCCGERGSDKAKDSNNILAKMEMSDTLLKPRIEIKVDRKYDNHGRLVQFDSTYSYVYRNNVSDFIKNDSLIKNFDKLFKSSFGDFNRPDNFYERLFDTDFFKDGIIGKSIEFEMKQKWRDRDPLKIKPLPEQQKKTKTDETI